MLSHLCGRPRVAERGVGDAQPNPQQRRCGVVENVFVCPTRTRINPYPSRRAVQSARSRCNSCGERRDLGDYQSFLRLSAQRVACLILRPYDNGGSYNNDSDNGDRYRRRLAWAWSLVLAESCQSSSPVRIAAEPSISSRNVLLLTRRIAIYAVGAPIDFFGTRSVRVTINPAHVRHCRLSYIVTGVAGAG